MKTIPSTLVLAATACLFVSCKEKSAPAATASAPAAPPSADVTAILAAAPAGEVKAIHVIRTTAKPGDDTEHEYTLPLAYYRRVVDGRVEIEIDMIAGVFIVDGIDRYAEIMAIISG